MALGGFAPSPDRARRLLAMPVAAASRPVARVYAVVALGLVALILAFYLVGWRPLTAYLAESNDFRLATAVDWAVEAVDDHLDRHRLLAEQIGSRSAIRDAQAALLDGAMSRAAFVDFAQDKLRDALDPRAGAVAIARYLPDGTRILSVGAPLIDPQPPLATPSAAAPSSDPRDGFALVSVRSTPTGVSHLIYRAPLIAPDGRFLGYDLIAMATDRLARLLGEAGEADIVHGVLIDTGGPRLLIGGTAPDVNGLKARLGAAAAGQMLPDRYLVKEHATAQDVLTVLSVVDAADYRAPVMAQQGRLLAVLIGGGAIVMVAAVLVMRPVIRGFERARAAARSRRFYRQLFDGSNAAMLLIDPAGGTLSRANLSARALLGSRVRAGEAPIDLAPVPGQALGPGSWQTQVPGADGAPLDLEVHATCVSWEDRAVLFAILHDVTQRVRQTEELALARREAEAANRAKSDFMSAMSHELRTPLNAILGFSEVIRDAHLGPPAVGHIADRYRGYAGDIHRSGEHLLQLIDDLLDLGRIEAGRMSLSADTVEPRQLIEDGVRLIEGRARAHGLTIHTDVPASLRPFVADSRAARQILFNLLSNAVKFTPDGGTIHVTVAQSAARETVIAVADNGIGIDRAEQDRLFQPFVRGSDAVRRAIQGTGLGLVLVRTLIERQGGCVTVTSRNGEGSRFTVTFPPPDAVRRAVATVRTP